MAKSLLRKVEERLQRIEAGELRNETINICNSGRWCKRREVFNRLTLCNSSVPCDTATIHLMTISKALP